MKPGRDVSAASARRMWGIRTPRLQVFVYAVDAERNLWGYTIANATRVPIARSVQPRTGVPGITFDALAMQLELIVGVKLQTRDGRGLVRFDHELSVAVRTIDSSTEIGFRSDAL